MKIITIDELLALTIPEPNTGCFLWSLSLQRGYGQLRHLGTTRKAHRLAWELANGPIPLGMHVLHKCDVRRCINPEHLFLGTNADNVADMKAKGRQARGEAHYNAKLTDADVTEIRRLRGFMLQRDIAARFGVSQSHLSNVINGKDRVS